MRREVPHTQRVLNLWAVIIIVWSFYRWYFRTELPPVVDEFIAKPLVFVLPVLYFIKRIEKREFFSGLDFHLNSIRHDVLIGVLLGLIFMAVGLLGNYLSQGVLIPTGKDIGFPQALYFASLALATGITEEILSRGFVLKRLHEEWQNVYSSSMFASILFFFMHIPILFTNDALKGSLLIQVMITDVVLSLIVSLLYLERRSLLVPILIHMFYNLSLYLLANPI